MKKPQYKGNEVGVLIVHMVFSSLPKSIGQFINVIYPLTMDTSIIKSEKLKKLGCFATMIRSIMY
jgi:hypothetical protein